LTNGTKKINKNNFKYMALIVAPETRPNRVIDVKDALYHLKMAKYCLYVGNDGRHTSWLTKNKVNKDFYKGDQWSLQEDKQTFLQDTTGNTTTRLALVQNLIRPMVEQYRGNSIILNINAAAKSISSHSLNRRDKRLTEQLFKTRVAQEFPNVGNIMRDNDPSIGKEEGQTEIIFENLYVDNLTREINDLLDYSKKLNRFQKKQVKASQNLALTGLAVEQAILQGGDLRFESIEPDDFFFDRDAREFDLTDAEFMGTVKPIDIPLVLERWNVKPEDAEALEEYTRNAGNATTYISSTNTRNYGANKVPVVTVYWKDTERYKYGWVMDEDNYPVLVRIGKKTTQNSLDAEKIYEEADLITPPDTPKNRKLFPNGKKTTMLYCDVLRYCTYIPSEVVSSMNSSEAQKYSDIILDWGMDPYQDTKYQDISNVNFPFKVAIWGYVDGEIFSPVDDAISPQRFINRMLSLSESRMNSSGGSNVIIDEDSVEDAEQTYLDIKEGKPITVRTRGKGIPNTVGYYDATPKAGTYQMFQMINNMQNLIQTVTGVNESLKGESTGSDQLVGVTQLMIQRGSLMQEPFYNALSDMFMQMYETVATVGKKYYIDNEKELSIIAGDEALKIFKLSDELRNEDFAIFVEKENSDQALKNNANQMLQVFLEMGMIDQEIFANLYERATPSKVMAEVRRFVKIQRESARRAEEQQNAMMQQEQAALAEAVTMEQAQSQAQKDQEFGRKMEEKMVDQDNKMEEIYAKELLANQQK
jgi:hypothetical protein